MKSLSVIFVLLLATVACAGMQKLGDQTYAEVSGLRIEQCLCGGCSHIDTIWNEAMTDSLVTSEVGLDSLFWEEIADAVWSDATSDIDTCDSPGLDTIRWERQCKWVPITRIKSDLTIIY